MNQSQCERESEVVCALRTGSLTEELSTHLQRCAMCVETEQVARSLLQHAAKLRAENEPATASQVWWRAQARKQEIALKRATRPLLFMRVLSAVSIAASAAWLLRSFWRVDSQALVRGWDMVGTGTASVGAAIAVFCIAIGALYLIHDGKRSGGVISST